MGSDPSFGFPRFLGLLVALFLSVLSGFFRASGFRPVSFLACFGPRARWGRGFFLVPGWPFVLRGPCLCFVSCSFVVRPLAPFRAPGRCFWWGFWPSPRRLSLVIPSWLGFVPGLRRSLSPTTCRFRFRRHRRRRESRSIPGPLRWLRGRRLSALGRSWRFGRRPSGG